MKKVNLEKFKLKMFFIIMVNFKSHNIKYKILSFRNNVIYYKNKNIGKIINKNNNYIIMNNDNKEIYRSNSLLITKQDLQEMDIEKIFNIC